MSTVGRLFPLLGLEAAQPRAQPKVLLLPIIASSLCSLMPLSLFFYILSFCTGSTSWCIWVMAGEQQLPVQVLYLCGSRAVMSVLPTAQERVGSLLEVTSSSQCRCGSAQIWGHGTGKPGWDPPLRTSGVTVRR